MTVQLSTLRVAADLDGSKFAQGANQMAAAQQQLVGGNRMVSVAMADLSGKVSQAGDPVARLSKQFIDGYGTAQRFEGGLRSLNRALESGKIEAVQAEAIYSGMTGKLGLVANGTDIAAQGFGRLGAVIDTVNARLASQTSLAARNTDALNRMAIANDNSSVGSGFRRQNLGYQAFDVGQGLALGMNPAMILAQQGPQIAQLYAGQGGLNALWKDSIGLLGSVARAAGPWIAAAGALYGAYKLIGSFSAEASLGIDKTTAALAKQAAPLGALEAQIGELSRIQDAYSKSLVTTGDVHKTMTDQIVADTQREFDAKKQLLELEVKRQQASIAVQQSEIAVAGLGLRRDVGQQVFTRSDLERQGFADPRINGGVPFVRLPDDITGLDKTRDVLENNPLSDKIKELHANLQLTEIGARKLQEALKQTFNDAGGAGGPSFAGGNIPIPHFRGVDDMPLSVEVYNDLVKSGKARVLQMQQEVDGLGLLGAAAASFRFEQDALNAAIAKNVELNPDQIAGIHALAVAYGKAADEAARAKLGADLQFEKSQQFLSPQEQAIASRLRGTGIGLNSPEAQQMRDIARFADAKGLAVGFLTDFKSELLRNGGDVGKALGESILNALTTSMDKQLADIFDRLATWIASLLTGQTQGIGTPALASAGSKIASSVLAGGANDNYLKGAVTRSPLADIGTASMSAYRDAIASVESAGSGNYSALGPVLKSGDQALGRYQIMASNLPSWSKSALGHSISRSEFMGDPVLQDKIFDNQFGSYLSKYGNSKDAFSAWFTGGPMSKGANKTDILGTSGSAYVNKATAALEKLSGSATQTAQSLAGGLGKLGQSLSQFPAAPALSGSPGSGGGGLLNSFLGKLFGGATGWGAAGNYLAANPGGYIGLYADGTESAPDGWAWVGERGPELRKLRGGDVIRSHGRSMDMAANANMSARGGGRGQDGRVEFNLNIDGANGDPHVRMLARQAAEEAIAQYHQAQASGGFGELQRRYASQKG